MYSITCIYCTYTLYLGDILYYIDLNRHTFKLNCCTCTYIYLHSLLGIFLYFVSKAKQKFQYFIRPIYYSVFCALILYLTVFRK